MRADTADRLERLLEAARRIADPPSPFGERARARLIASSELSPQGVELALRRSLECAPSRAALEALTMRAAPAAPRARVHVLLSAGVFTAAHRAIATALAASSSVEVRASRRDPLFPELLHEAAPGLFSLVPELSPSAGEHVFAYGSRETLDALRQNLPRGVVLHGHGPGFGVVALDERALLDAALVAEDVAVFDQRGCLSPRVVLVEGRRELAIALAERLARALSEIAVEVPVGRLSSAERAEITRYRDAWAYSGTLIPAAHGFVGVAPQNAPFTIAPVGRNLHVVVAPNAAELLATQAPNITTYAATGDRAFVARIQQALPRARPSAIGHMQSPAFDGPVDLREPPEGQIL